MSIDELLDSLESYQCVPFLTCAHCGEFLRYDRYDVDFSRIYLGISLDLAKIFVLHAGCHLSFQYLQQLQCTLTINEALQDFPDIHDFDVIYAMLIVQSVKRLPLDHPMMQHLLEKYAEEVVVEKKLVLSPTTRFQILKRDHYRCRLCGIAAKDGDEVRLEVDHITPRSKGGDDDSLNLWTLCFDCNRGKGIREL